MKQSKREKLTEFNRRNILDAARDLFLHNGIEKTSVDKIAQTADCSKATIYVYFKSKEDIYYHIVLEYMNLLKAELIQSIETTSLFEETYLSICNALVRFEQDYPMYFECILGNISVDPIKFRELPVLEAIYQEGETINNVIRSFLQEAKELGSIDSNIDLALAEYVLWSSISGWVALTANKEAYFSQSLGLSRSDCLTRGFYMILSMLQPKE